jgi:hypothetical protein
MKMATDATTLETITRELTDDGDTWWNDDESIGYRLNITTDDTSAIEHINDCDCYGRVEWAGANIDRNTGHYRRPDGMTGAARLLRPNGWHIDSPVWWEPYREGRKVYATDDDVRFMTELLGDGFKVVVVTRLERGPANIQHHASGVSYCWDCGSRLVLMADDDGEMDTHECDEQIREVNASSLGGIDTVVPGYLAEIVAEMVSELASEREAMVTA